MEKLRRKISETEQALKTLDEILMKPYSIIVRDATIQRFEYTFKSFWKTLKEYLKEYEGVQCGSPKSCFREAMSIGLLSEEETVMCLEMTDYRNLTSHTYLEEVAQRIYEKVKDYYKLMSDIINRIKENVEEYT